MTESQRTWGLRAVVAALLIGLGAWLASYTEWAEIEVPMPPRGEAARNRFHATQQLVRRVGGTVATPANLAQLPPPTGTLLLTSWHWDIFPERSQRLRQWVENGGHLVLFSDNLRQEQLKGWLPITLQDPKRGKKADADDDEQDDDDESAERDAGQQQERETEDRKEREERQGRGQKKGPNALMRLIEMPCKSTVEPDSVAPYYPGGQRHYELCGIAYSGWTLRSSTPVLWAIDGRDGPLLLRTAKGRGTVTVIKPWALLDNERVLKSDNGLAAVAALQAGPGRAVWFVAEEARPSLLAWLWQEANVVLLLGGVALALGLWRGARRFGPLAAGAALGRRSMTEQIAGTAQFLRQQGPEALLAAQIRALEAAARNHIHQYDKLDRGQRAAAIAKHTGQDAAALASALDKSLARKRTDLPATLERLETARRLLAQKKPTPSSRSEKD